jgi:hypothetical protein
MSKLSAAVVIGLALAATPAWISAAEDKKSSIWVEAGYFRRSEGVISRGCLTIHTTHGVMGVSSRRTLAG